MKNQKLKTYLFFFLFLLSIIICCHFIIVYINSEKVEKNEKVYEMPKDDSFIDRDDSSSHNQIADHESSNAFLFTYRLNIQNTKRCKIIQRTNILYLKQLVITIANNNISEYNFLSSNSTSQSYYLVINRNKYFIYDLRHLLI